MALRRLTPVFVALLLLGACASSGPDQLVFGEEGWRAAVSKRGYDPDQVIYPFAFTPEMAAWANEATIGCTGAASHLRAVQNALFNRGEFQFTYDEDLTLTARDAFERRRGNCLAFTALFIALSRSIGLPTFLVSVERVLDVSREENLVIVNRHVVAGFREAGSLRLFDFYLSSESPHLQQRIIDDMTGSAMYHTNIGGRLLKEGKLYEASTHLLVATALDPNLAAAWVNLGVARRREGDADGALQAYEVALQVQPGHASALTNMAYLFSEAGMREEARDALLAAAEGTTSPFSLIALADVEMARGQHEDAGRYLRRARWSYRDVPEVYDALARWARAGGRMSLAVRYTERADRLRAEQVVH